VSKTDLSGGFWVARKTRVAPWSRVTYSTVRGVRAILVITRRTRDRVKSEFKILRFSEYRFYRKFC